MWECIRWINLYLYTVFKRWLWRLQIYIGFILFCDRKHRQNILTWLSKLLFLNKCWNWVFWVAYSSQSNSFCLHFPILWMEPLMIHYSNFLLCFFHFEQNLAKYFPEKKADETWGSLSIPFLPFLYHMYRVFSAILPL